MITKTKYHIFITLSVLLFVSCENVKNNLQTNQMTKADTSKEISVDSIKGAYLSLDKTKYDFGTVKRKKTPHIAIDFEVENIGKCPLVILKTDVSCSCLSVNYPKETILPGKKRTLTVNIDTKSQDGEFNKTVFIKSNSENDLVLVRIVGKVK